MYWSNLLLTLSVVGSGLTRSSQLRREALGGVEPSITANETLTGARKYIIEAGQVRDGHGSLLLIISPCTRLTCDGTGPRC
jgi:hypothetical protein